MYLRATTRKKDGKVHRYWQLVESVRIGRRVIQRTVAQLGELDGEGKLKARALARHLISAPEQATLFDDGHEHVTVPVRLKGIRIERARQFGDVYLALALWRGTGLAELCEALLPAGETQVPWATIIAVLVTARLCEPSSELHVAEDWCRASRQHGQNAWAEKGDFHCSGGPDRSLLIDRFAMCTGRSDSPCTQLSKLFGLPMMPRGGGHVAQRRV